MRNDRVYEIEYTNPKIIINTPYGCEELQATTQIRATTATEARRIFKRMTGALIKNMKIKTVRGYNYCADNDYAKK